MKSRAQNSESEHTQFRNGPAPRVLCVDDNDSVREVICHVLSFAGFQCESAGDGEAALQRLAQGPEDFDVLVTDNKMPRVNGLELVARLRDRGFDRMIIVHSAHLTAVERAAYEALGVDAILIKPLDSVNLVQTISDFSEVGQVNGISTAPKWKTRATVPMLDKGGAGCRSSFK